MHSISAHDAKARFGQLLDTARREPVVIERHGRPVAVILSKEDFDALTGIKLAQLRTEVDAGIKAVEQGDYVDYDESGLRQLEKRIKSEGRERMPIR
jgi:prevent-host-death family protein